MPLITEIEVEDAFIKLKNYYYYEKTDIVTRNNILNWDISKTKELTNQINSFSDEIHSLLNKIKLTFYPKEFEENNNKQDQNYYSNININKLPKVTNFLIFIDAPIEIHIISTLWAIKIGPKLDERLGPHCYGNRIFSSAIRGRQLFKKYQSDYKKWWKNALKISQERLEQKNNVSILTFDIKSYYHSIELNFIKLYKSIDLVVDDSNFYKIFKKIHESYKIQLQLINHPDVTSNSNLFPIPIGLLSSAIIANYHLIDLDNKILKTAPKYYGRYVDDIILVYTNSYNSKNSTNQIDNFFKKKLTNIFYKSDKNNESFYQINIASLKNLKLHKNKIFLHEFSHTTSPVMLNVLIEEQKHRSSEFRFLSDILDENFSDFDSIVFEDSFQFDDGNKVKFKEANEDRFKMASFLSKLIQKKIENGLEYKSQEIIKVYKYFKGKYYLKHYYFWEKLLTLFWVSKEYRLFNNTIKEITNSINNIQVHEKWNFSNELIKNNLKLYLEHSAKLAVNLSRNKSKSASLYIDNSIQIRDNYSIFPFLPYTKAYKESNVDLLDSLQLEKLKLKSHLLELNYETISIGKPFYWCYIYIFFYNTLTDKIINISQEQLLNESYILFKKINKCSINKDKLFKIKQLNSLSSNNLKVYEIFDNDNFNLKNTYRVAILNQLVKESDFTKSLVGKPIVDLDRIESIKHKLDEASKIEALDLLVKPELSIPYSILYKEIMSSAKNKFSLNSGIEFISSTKFGYNFILSTLPITLNGVYDDCIPVIRLKNNYSYEEEKLIYSKKLKVPKNIIKEYYLFRVKGLSFSSYYCFELTSINERSIFKSMVDLIVAPIFNKDSYYFRSISETLVRDLHCYYAQSNTSKYPDSRILQPTKSLFIEIARVSNGTVTSPRSNFNFIISDLDIFKLRNFQKMSYKETQEKPFSKKNIFKPVPPDWKLNNVLKRISNESMDLENEKIEDLSDLPF